MGSLPEIGTKVRVQISNPAGMTKYSGVIIPGAEKEYMTLKLANGYNVSCHLNEIMNIEVLDQKSMMIREGKKRITQNKNLPRVTIIHTGGTIASKVDYSTGAVVARFEPDELLSEVPELQKIAQVDTIKIGNMWSDDVRPQHWNLMIDATQKAFEGGSTGVVITHGTDTMHISSSALAFAFAGNGGRPAGRIVFTGSQRSSDRGSTDATENLISAVHWAANGPDVNGLNDTTVTVMHAGIGDGVCAVNPGIGVRKMHSTKRDAFQTINHETIALIEIVKTSVTDDSVTTPSDREILKPSKYDTSIRIAQFIAGPHLHGDLIKSAVENGYRAILIHGTGLGHLPIEDSAGDSPENQILHDILNTLSIPIIIANQCINGPVDLNVYSKGRIQKSLGILGHGATTTPETLLTKIHWILSQKLDLETELQKNLCGENNPILNI